MKLTKEFIQNRINRLLITFKESWENIVVELDAGIMEINSYMSTKFPLVSEIITDESSPETTYSYRAGGKDVPFFPDKYFLNIVIPFAAAELLTIDEEFGESFSKYKMQVEENLFIMVRDELHNINNKFVEDYKGVYFADPDPQFKENPEQFFNRKTQVEKPLLKIEYSWGNFKSHLPMNQESFVSSPLPVDNNFYNPESNAPIIRLSNNTYNTFIVDYNKQVLGIFIGWSYDNDNDPNKIINQDYIEMPKDTDVKLYAVFNLSIIGIRYNGNGGTLTNWKPVYIPSNLNPGDFITPYGGEAFKLGHKFNTFSPKSIPYDFLEEFKNTISEFEFRAKWQKETYEITFIYKGAEWIPNFGSEKFTYIYGNEFDLPTPPPMPNNPEEFIGWWDNPQFLGNPITKIHRSDYGSKIFYGDFNNEKVSIIWFSNNIEKPFSIIIEYSKGQIISEYPQELIPFLTPFENQSNWNGLYYIYTFDNTFLNDRNEKISFGQSIANRNMSIKASYERNEDPVLINLFIRNVAKVDGGFEEIEFEIPKGILKTDLEKYLKDNFEFLPDYNNGETIFYFKGYDLEDLNVNHQNRIINPNEYIDVIYDDSYQEFQAHNLNVSYIYTELNLKDSLNWDLETTEEEVENSLMWIEDSEDYEISDLIYSLNYIYEQSEYDITFVEEEIFRVGKYVDGLIKKQAIETMIYNKNYMSFDNIPLNESLTLYFQNSFKVKLASGEYILLENDINASNFPEIIDIIPVFDFSPAVMEFMMMGFKSPIAEITYQNNTIIKQFFSEDLNHDNLLEINFKDYTRDLFVETYQNRIFKGFQVNNTTIFDEVVLINHYEENQFDISKKYEFKKGFNLMYNVKIKNYIPLSINNYMTYEDMLLLEEIFNHYKEYITDAVDIPSIEDFNYLNENKNIILFNENKVENIGNNEYPLYPNAKNKISTGLTMFNYKYNDIISDSYPVDIKLPKAKETIQDIPVEIEFKLENEFGYKRIFISNQMIIENGNTIEYVNLSEIISDLKELYIVVPTFEALINNINTNMLLNAGYYDIKLYDFNNNDITNSYISEDTYVIIKARRM